MRPFLVRPRATAGHGRRRFLALGVLLTGLLGFMAAMPAMAKPSNKWRIELNHKASVAGEIELSFVTGGAGPVNVVVSIPSGTHENHAAHLVMDAIRAKFGKSFYKTEIDDGEDVLVKKHSGPDFEIVVVRNTADGLTVKLKRE